MTSTPRPDPARRPGGTPSGPWWWGGLALGGAVMLFGLTGLLHDAAKTKPTVWLAWIAGCVLAHDLVIAPAAHLAGAWLRRAAPGLWRWPLQLGLVTSGVIALASVPVLYGGGRATQPGNRSVLPGDYPRALLGVLALTWAAVALLALVTVRRGRLGPARRGRLGPARREQGPGATGRGDPWHAGSDRGGRADEEGR